MKTLTVTIPGPPMAKRRHRTVPAHQCMGCQKCVQGMYKECPECGGALRFLTNKSYSDSESVRYENLIAYCAKQAMTTQGVPMFVGTIQAKLVFHFPIPVSRICKKHIAEVNGAQIVAGVHERKDCKKLHPGDPHNQRPDLDNLIKSLDGYNGIVFADDCIIARMVAEKFWAAEGRAEILVESLEG